MSRAKRARARHVIVYWTIISALILMKVERAPANEVSFETSGPRALIWAILVLCVAQIAGNDLREQIVGRRVII